MRECYPVENPVENPLSLFPPEGNKDWAFRFFFLFQSIFGRSASPVGLTIWNYLPHFCLVIALQTFPMGEIFILPYGNYA